MTPQRRCGMPKATGRISPTTPTTGMARTNTWGWSNTQETCSYRFCPAPKRTAPGPRRSIHMTTRLATSTGRLRSHTAPATNIDQENSGMRSRLMPAGRWVHMVVSRTPVAPSSDSTTRAKESRESSTARCSPPAARPPSIAQEAMRMPAPVSQPQKAAAAARGKATPRAPICRGTTCVARPIHNGMTNRKTRPTR